MVKASHAAPRDRNALPADEQEAGSDALGQPAKDSVTKTLPPLELPLRIDVFPWLDLDDLATFARSPYRYAQYSAACNDRYLNRGQKDIFFDALEYPDEEFGALTVGDTPFSSVRGSHIGADDDTARLEASTEVKTAPTNRRTDTKKSDIPKKLSFDEWIAREWTFHDPLWVASKLYDPIPPDTIYIAQDKYRRNILAVFPNGLEIAYGYSESDRYIVNTIYNLEGYAYSQPPPSLGIADIYITHGGLRKIHTSGRQTGVAALYTGAHGLNWERIRALCSLKIL
ncbi:MAG: hypothetical protein M1813_005640 [Trichoglossum hirsutum]|nr:MAG: hypothetical protein M1813_005640 [Trichoglossum hirsutum]